MKYFIVLLAVGAVFAQQPFDTSFDNQQEADKTFEDNQQDIKTQNVENDDTKRPPVIHTTDKLAFTDFRHLFIHIHGIISGILSFQPGRFKTYIQ